MKILVSGATGFIGTPLVAFLGSMGHQVHRLIRGHAQTEGTDILWDPAEARLASSDLSGAEAVVCLSGANIAQGRWTESRKQELRRSRIQSVSLLSKTIAAMEDPPATLVCASAVGYYGTDRGEEILSEATEPGEDFLAQLCVDWERAAQPAADKGVRVVALRFGIVLSPAGGALAKMLPLFKLGLGGKIGSGRQYMSWLSIDEAVSIIDFVIQCDEMAGPVNAVSPHPVTNSEFTKRLARTLSRPALMGVPSAAIRLALGPMGDALLLSSIRALPARLQEAGYIFIHKDLEPTLKYLLGR